MDHQNSGLLTLKKYIPLKSKPEDLEASYQANFHLLQRMGIFNQSQNLSELTYKSINPEALGSLVAKLREALAAVPVKDLLDRLADLFREVLLAYNEFKVG